MVLHQGACRRLAQVELRLRVDRRNLVAALLDPHHLLFHAHRGGPSGDDVESDGAEPQHALPVRETIGPRDLQRVPPRQSRGRCRAVVRDRQQAVLPDYSGPERYGVSSHFCGLGCDQGSDSRSTHAAGNGPDLMSQDCVLIRRVLRGRCVVEPHALCQPYCQSFHHVSKGLRNAAGPDVLTQQRPGYTGVHIVGYHVPKDEQILDIVQLAAGKVVDNA